MEAETPRSKKVAARLSTLTPDELHELQQAANGMYEAGDELQEPLRARAVKLELAYASSGRLRPDVYNLFKFKRQLVYP